MYEYNVTLFACCCVYSGNQVVSVNTLERCGPVLLTNCISKSIVDKRENGCSTSELWNNPINNEILLEMLKLFPDTLSLDNVLVYCSLHSASQWNKVFSIVHVHICILEEGGGGREGEVNAV